MRYTSLRCRIRNSDRACREVPTLARGAPLSSAGSTPVSYKNDRGSQNGKILQRVGPSGYPQDPDLCGPGEDATNACERRCRSRPARSHPQRVSAVQLLEGLSELVDERDKFLAYGEL